MFSAEETVSMIDSFSVRAQAQRGRWRQFRHRELSKQETVELNQDLERFIETIDDESRVIHGKMSGILLVPDYKDITAQMIRQVVNMVQEAGNNCCAW